MLDIGSGDGRLAAHLAAAGHRVVASEVRRGPLAVLSRALAGTGVEVRFGSGLEVTTPGELDTAVIAGMGGRRIARILAGSPETVAALRCLVLQPVQHETELREALPGLGLAGAVAKEAVQRGRRYTVLVVTPGPKP